MNDALRIGIVGTGFVGRAVHLPAWASVPGAHVVAVCDADPVARDLVASRLAPGVRLVADYRDLLASGVDAVSICTPNLLHAPIALEALRAGAHVFVEKPLAVAPADIRALGAEAEARGRVLAVRHQLRFTAGAEAARARARELGPIRRIRARALRRDRIPTTPGLTDAAQAGGGAALDLGVHVLDMALWLADRLSGAAVAGARVTGMVNAAYGRGETPGYRNAWGAWDTARFTVEDAARAEVVFPDGLALSLECAWAGAFAPEVVGTWCELDGEAGTLRWEAPSPEPPAPQGIAGRGGVGGAATGATAEAPPDFLAFAAACRAGTPFPVGWREALVSCEVLDAFYRAVRAGGTVGV